MGSMASSPVLSAGNTAFFGDPMMTGEQYLLGVAGGALLGGGVNGISALANGKTFWSGSVKSLPASSIRPSTMPLNSSKPEMKVDALRSKPAQIPEETSYTVRTNSPEGTIYSPTDGHRIELKVPRPEIQGYHSSIAAKTDLYHNFPRVLDNTIVQSGSVAQRISDGSLMFTAPGTIKGVSGVYTIGVDSRGVIFHRCFYDWPTFLKNF